MRARIINTPARVSRSGRRQRLHLPERWPWAKHWQTLWTAALRHLTTDPQPPRPEDPGEAGPDRQNEHAPDHQASRTPLSRHSAPADHPSTRWIQA